MNKDIAVSNNILALARRRKKKGKGNKRSLMLKMVMPMLSRENGDKLADAIKDRNPSAFKKVWDEIKNQIAGDLERTKATANQQNHRLTAEMITLVSESIP